MSSSSIDVNTPIEWSSIHVAGKLIEMYEKSLPAILAPTVPYATRSSSSSSTPMIPLDILPDDIMYTHFSQTVTLALDLCTIQGLYHDIDPESGDYFGHVHHNILMNICNRLGLEHDRDVLQSSKDAIWDFIEELQSSDPTTVLFLRFIEKFLIRFRPLTKDSMNRQDCIKSFRNFLKQETVMVHLATLDEKTFAKVYKVFQLYNTDGRFSVKLGNRLTAEKIDTARAILTEYVLNAPVSSTTSGTGTMSTRSGSNGVDQHGSVRRVSIQDIGETTGENGAHINSNNDMIIQMKKQIDLLTSMVGKGHTFQSNNNAFSSIIDSIPATTPQRSPTRSGRIRTAAISTVPAVPVSSKGVTNVTSGTATSNSNKNNSLFDQLQYMSSTGAAKSVDSDSDEDDGEYGNSTGSGFGGIHRGNGVTGGVGSGINGNGHDSDDSGTFDTNLYMTGCLVCEESFASILQKEIRSYSSHEQYYRQELMNKINSKQISYEIGRLVMLCDALHGIGIGNNVPSIFTKHHIYEIISRIIVGLQIADQNGTYDTLEGLIGQQKFALPVSIISQLNKARLQGKKLESRKVLDSGSSNSFSSSSNGATFNRMNQHIKSNNSFNYNNHRGGRGGSFGTHRGGGAYRGNGGHRGGFNNNSNSNNGNGGHHTGHTNNVTSQRGGTGGAGITNQQ